jgi:hypothetical protein
MLASGDRAATGGGGGGVAATATVAAGAGDNSVGVEHEVNRKLRIDSVTPNRVVDS